MLVQVVDVGSIPDPQGTPYPDALLALRCRFQGTDARGDARNDVPEEFLVYVWGFQNRRMARASNIRPRDNCQLRLRPWSEVESELGRVARLELDDLDESLLDLPVYFGEFVP